MTRTEQRKDDKEKKGEIRAGSNDRSVQGRRSWRWRKFRIVNENENVLWAGNEDCFEGRIAFGSDRSIERNVPHNDETPTKEKAIRMQGWRAIYRSGKGKKDKGKPDTTPQKAEEEEETRVDQRRWWWERNRENTTKWRGKRLTRQLRPICLQPSLLTLTQIPSCLFTRNTRCFDGSIALQTLGSVPTDRSSEKDHRTTTRPN